MRVLHTCEFYHPHVGGAEEVVRQISERLVRRGHQVTVASSADAARNFSEFNGVAIHEFAIRGNAVKGFRGEIQRFVAYIAESNYDVIMNYAAQSWPTDLTFTVLDQIKCPKVIAPCGYSGLVGWRRFLYMPYFRRLPRYLRQYDAIVYHSANYRDRHFGDRHGITNYVIIPNAVAREEFASPPINFRQVYGITTPHMLLTVGNHYRGKGHRFVIDSFEALGRDDVTLIMIGNSVEGWYRSCQRECERRAAASGGRIRTLASLPRAHVVSAYFAADIFVFGSRVEAFPLVILESMASCTPFVTTDVGNVRELRGGIIVNSPQGMMEQILVLLDNPAQREALGEEGYRVWRSKYEWERVTDLYEQLYLELGARKRRKATP